MITVTNAVRTTGRVNKSKGVSFAEPLPWDEDTPVEIIVIPTISVSDEISDAEWLKAAANNPAFADWNHPEEDIYSPDEGVPFDEHR